MMLVEFTLVCGFGIAVRRYLSFVLWSDGSPQDKLRIWPTADTTGNDFPSFFPQFVQFYFELFVIGMPYHLVFPHSHVTR